MDLPGAIFRRLSKRAAEESDPEAPSEPSKKEIDTSWALLILILLLMAALFTSYMLQMKKVQAVHETVISVFGGMIVGLTLRLTEASGIQQVVSFNYQFFFNLLLPPIILASGYELHQANFFRNIGSILTFAFAGTFISAVIIGVILWLWTRIPLEGLNISFVEAMSTGATLSATDPVTILAIFNTYKVDPKLYTIIFGESILNDAIAIVLFQTAQKYKEDPTKEHHTGLTPWNLFEGIGIFLIVFVLSLLIGLVVGVGTALALKFTYIRRYPRIESCLILLVAYASYFFSTAIDMSGIVSLLFCGITLKHYAYYNMSRRTQLTTKFIFQIMSQLSENFIFIYLGLGLFTQQELTFKPLFILVTLAAICVARYVAVFPLSKAINWVIRYRARRRGVESADEIPFQYQAMLFWAGLRGAVGVALAAGLTGKNSGALRAAVLVVVVLTVIIFGGTTSRMLEILGIQTGVDEEVDSDDEFDIEHVSASYYKQHGTSIGHLSKSGRASPEVEQSNGRHKSRNGFASGHASGSPTESLHNSTSRKNTSDRSVQPQASLLPHDDESGFGSDDSDLPPAAHSSRRSTRASRNPWDPELSEQPPREASKSRGEGTESHLTASGAFNQLFRGTSDDQAALFRQIDEDFIKPKLLLDPGRGRG